MFFNFLKIVHNTWRPFIQISSWSNCACCWLKRQSFIHASCCYFCLVEGEPVKTCVAWEWDKGLENDTVLLLTWKLRLGSNSSSLLIFFNHQIIIIFYFEYKFAYIINLSTVFILIKAEWDFSNNTSIKK